MTSAVQVDNVTIGKNELGQLEVKDNSITSAKLDPSVLQISSQEVTDDVNVDSTSWKDIFSTTVTYKVGTIVVFFIRHDAGPTIYFRLLIDGVEVASGTTTNFYEKYANVIHYRDNTARQNSTVLVQARLFSSGYNIPSRVKLKISYLPY